MPDWNDIFTENGKVFFEPHPDIERLDQIFEKSNVKKILDLGCGTGRHLIFFSKKGYDIYGIDASSKGIEIAQEWLTNEGLCVETVCCRIEDTFPYDDNFFDAIISIQVIHHNFMVNILKTIKEIERVLRRGGYIFITFPYLKNKKIKRDNWDLKRIEGNTFIPQKGKEKGLAHHYFSQTEIQNVFKSFDLIESYIDKTDHRALLGIKK